MYTQCPECQTVFNLTVAQLKVRDGLVRCGMCATTFRANRFQLKVPPPEEEIEKPKRARARRGSSRPPIPRHDPSAPPQPPARVDIKLPLSLGALRPSRYRAGVAWALWFLGSILLLGTLSAQFVFFYRNELAQLPGWQPWVTEFCDYTDCDIKPPRDIAQIELLKTTIAPHPKFNQALRLRTAMVNRAAFRQALPSMEVSLTNNAGNVIARRVFTPPQYLENPFGVGTLTPNVVVTALLDVTNLDGKAVGYEIRLVAMETH